MANGNNHAKQILIDDLNSTVRKLENGSAGDIVVIGEAVCRQGKILAVMFEGNYRTVEDCDVIHKEMVLKYHKQSKVVKVKLGIIAFDVPIPYSVISSAPSFICCVVSVAMMGRLLNWW